MEEHICTDFDYIQEEILTDCMNDAVVVFKEICVDCGAVSYGYEISDRDGDIIDADGGFETLDDAIEAAYNADENTFYNKNY